MEILVILLQTKNIGTEFFIEIQVKPETQMVQGQKYNRH